MAAIKGDFSGNVYFQSYAYPSSITSNTSWSTILTSPNGYHTVSVSEIAVFSIDSSFPSTTNIPIFTPSSPQTYGFFYGVQVNSSGNMFVSNLNTHEVLWQSNTAKGVQYGPYTLTIRNDRNLVLTDGMNNMIWQSNTAVPNIPLLSATPLGVIGVPLTQRTNIGSPLQMGDIRFLRNNGRLYIYWNSAIVPQSCLEQVTNQLFGCFQGTTRLIRLTPVVSNVSVSCYDGGTFINRTISGSDPCYCQALSAHTNLASTDYYDTRDCPCGSNFSKACFPYAIVIGCSVGGGVFLLCVACCCYCRRKRKTADYQTLQAPIVESQ